MLLAPLAANAVTRREKGTSYLRPRFRPAVGIATGRSDTDLRRTFLIVGAPVRSVEKEPSVGAARVCRIAIGSVGDPNAKPHDLLAAGSQQEGVIPALIPAPPGY